MNPQPDSLADLVERLRRKCPEYLDLITAETEEEFEAAFCVLLEQAISHLERNKRNFRNLDEEGLTAVLCGRLSAPGLTVTQETNSNGHVDLTVDADHCSPPRRRLCEAKIYAGPSYHIKGITQLIARYLTARDDSGLLINYVRQPDIKGITDKLRAELDRSRPVDQVGTCDDHTLKWSLRTKHRHSSGEAVAVNHIGCNLHF